MTDINGSRILVTGAANGIGRRLALALAREGAELVLWDIDTDGLDALQSELAAAGTGARCYRCDLSRREEIAVVAERTLADVGRVDVLINNAGVVSGKSLLEIPDAEIERTFAVNALAPFWTVRAFLPGMLERGSGHIVTIASAAGLAGTARLTDYCASKFAAVGFDEALRIELAQQGSGVLTTIVCPYFVATGMFEGVSTRFSRLLPVLDPDRVVQRTLRAVRRNRRRLVMPWFVYTVWPTRLLPVPIFDRLMKFFGVADSMNAFSGRQDVASQEEVS